MSNGDLNGTYFRWTRSDGAQAWYQDSCLKVVSAQAGAGICRVQDELQKK